jgi:hypothetical protein
MSRLLLMTLLSCLRLSTVVVVSGRGCDWAEGEMRGRLSEGESGMSAEVGSLVAILELVYVNMNWRNRTRSELIGCAI